MAYDFDRNVERRGTNSYKWDYGAAGENPELLPLWVADMDFEPPREVVEAVRKRVAHGIFGYTFEPESYFEAAMGWLRRRHGVEVKRDWVVSAPGVVPSIVTAIRAFTHPGDKVVIQPPVYHPFAIAVRSNGRLVCENPLRLSGIRYEMDLDGLSRLMDDRARLLILCSPHNPVGRVWEKETLSRLVEICAERGVVLISDEIHQDIVMEGFRHVPITSLPGVDRIAVMLFAPTKTFNIAGLSGSFAVIPDEELRRKFAVEKQNTDFPFPNPLSLAGQEAAYRHGDGWLEALLGYIKGNYEALVEAFSRRLPAVKVFPLEGTYLAWLDMRGLGLSDEDLKEGLIKKAGVWLDEGVKFGRGGEGFQRINLACPRRILMLAIDRIAAALSGLARGA